MNFGSDLKDEHWLNRRAKADIKIHIFLRADKSTAIYNNDVMTYNLLSYSHYIQVFIDRGNVSMLG